MEEIEYLEEYEDLILPRIKSSTNAPKRPSSMANVPDDEDSSSIDQDIFESLFDDHSDDDNVPQKKAHPKFNQRRDERPSMDSIDLLVKDLGEPPQNTRPRTEHSSAGNSSRLNPKAMSKERSATAKPGTIASTARADSSTRPEKPKSVATVRPTVQSQSQEKRTSSARTTTSSRAVSSTQSPTVLPVGSSMTKAGTSGLFALSSRKQISVATSTTTTLEAVRSGLVTEAAKKPSRSQPTIIKPEKPQSRDPVEDPLSLDNINHESDSDSLSLSDISADSFVSLSDEDGRNIIELSNDSSLERANFDKIRGATPSPIVSEDNKSDKGESPGKLMLDVVTTAETTDNQTKMSPTTDEDVRTKASGVDHEEIIARCISPKASKCVVITEFPEKAIVVSDTLLPRCDSVPLRATVTNDESKVTSSGKQCDDELVGSTKAGLSKSEVSTTEQEKSKHTNKADEESNAGSSSELSDSKKTFGKSAKGLALKESDEGEVESNQPEENEKCSEENIEKSTLVVGSSVQTSADTNAKLSKTEVFNEKHIDREVIGKTGIILENQESLPGSVEQCSQIINGGEAKKSESGRKDKEAPTMQSETAQSNELVKRTKSIEASEEEKSLIDASCMAKESNPKEMSLKNQEITNQTTQDGNRDKLNGKQDGCRENAKSIKRSQRKHESDDKKKPQSSGNSQEFHKNAELCEEEEENKVALHSDNEVKVVDVSIVKNAQSVVEKASTEDCDAKETDNKNLDAVKKSDDSAKEPESIAERDISTKKHNEVNPEENQRGTRGNKMNKKASEKNDTVKIPSEETQRDEVGTVIPTDFKKLEREKTNTSKEKSTEKPFETLESSQFEPQKQRTEDKKASDETKNSILEGPRDNCVQENEISMEQQLDKTTMNSNYSDANDEQDNKNLQSNRRVKKKKGNKNCAEENESTKNTAKCPVTPAYEKTEYKNIAQGSIERAADSGCSSVKATDKSTTSLVNSLNQVENGNLSHNPEEDVLRRRSLRKRCAEQSPLNDVSKKIVKQPLSSGTVKPKAQTASATSPKRSTRSLVIQLQGKEESSDQKDKTKTEVKRKSARLPCDNMEGLTNLSKNESETSNAKKRCKSEAAQDHGSSLVNVNLRQKPSEEGIAEIGPRPKNSQKSEKSILENKLENATEKKMSAPKVDNTKSCEESAKMVKVKDKAEMTSLSHGSKRKLPQRKEKSMLAVGGSPLKSKCDRADISEPPKKLSRLDLDLQASQKETERKKQEKTSENEKSRVVLNNSRNKKVFTSLEESSPKFVRADKSSNDPLKIVKNCLDVDHGVTLHLTPEKRTQRLKAIDERYPSNLATEHDVVNQVAPSKALPETQRKSLRAKAACTEKDRITEQNQDNTSPTQNSTEKSPNPEEEHREPEKHVEKDARKGEQNPEVKTKSSQGDKDSSPTKKSKPSPKKSPGSTVITFKEWLNQRQFEDVEKGLEHLHEEHDDPHKSLEETNKEINKRSKNKANFSKNNTSTTHVANTESVSNTSNTKKIKTRSVRKSEVEVLRELKDSAVAMLLEEKHPRRMLKSGSSKTFPHITSPLAAGGKGELPTTFSEKFKVPVTPQRLRGTPVRSLADRITNEVPHVSGSSTDGVDKAENRNKFYKKFKLRKLRVRMNRASVTAYLRSLATQKPMSRTTDASSLESSTVPELDGTLGLTQSKTQSNAVSAAQSTVGKSAVTLTQKRVALRTKPAPVITGPANVLTIPPHQRRALPLPTKPSTVTTRDKNSTVDTCEPDSSQMDTSLLTPIKSSTVNTIAATRKQPPLHQEERHQPDTRSAETEVVPPANSSAINELSSAAPFTPVEPKEEIVDEALNTAATPVGINSSTTRTVGSVVVSQSALSAAGTTFGVAPTVIDSNGTRLYSFLHPAKYQRSHGCVLLDYCCPNLDGPMPAIDPTRIHTQVQAAVRELPAYIVMTTKLITRADLEANKNVIPASIRQKVEKITANAVGNTSTISSVVPALPVSVPAQPVPLITPTISALQKQLPPTTTITPKILPSNPIGATTASNALTVKDTPLPPLTPFSAISNSHSIVPSSPLLVEYQRSLLRSHLRQFDACLKKHYPRIGMLTFSKRQQIVENVLSTTTLSAKDVEIAVRLLEEYAAQINSTASSMVPSGSQQQRLAQSNTTPKPKTTPARAPTATTATQQQQQQLQQQLKRQVPIYDVYKNIIGYQLQMTAPSTGVTVTKSVMSARSEVMSTSANTKSASLSNVYAASTPTSSLKSLTQESPRIFYTKPPLQTSTPIASSAGTTPMGSSITLRSAPRLNREITIRRVSPPNASSTITPPSVGRLPTLTRNPHLSAVITSAQRTSTTVTTQASVTMAPTSRRITRKTAATTAAKVIVVTQGHSQNDQSTTDECILPDDNNSPQIKHEKVDDDFISAN